MLMASSFPKLVERFPASYDDFCRWRFQDSLLDELCFDYERILNVIDSEGKPADTTSSSMQELRVLASKLEYEFLQSLATHVAVATENGQKT
jgi:hypothetical protein